MANEKCSDVKIMTIFLPYTLIKMFYFFSAEKQKQDENLIDRKDYEKLKLIIDTGHSF